MLKIGVDLDSTLNNLYKVWLLDRYNKMYGDNLSEGDLISYNVLQSTLSSQVTQTNNEVIK